MPTMVAHCVCRSVEIECPGAPITSLVCYCDTCQEGSGQLEALPNAAPVREADGGTGYVSYRKDRVRFVSGTHLLRDIKLSEDSATVRVVAGCCNAAMFMKFEDARHWVAVYRSRIQGELPPLEFRICTKFRTQNGELPDDVPSSSMYPFGLMLKLATSKIAMLLGG